MGLLNPLMGLFFLLLLIAAVVGFGYPILGPFDAAARGKRRYTQIALSDLLCLVVWVALPLSLLARGGLGGREPNVFWYCSVAIVVVIVSIWWYGESTLSAVGVSDPRRRSVFLLVLLPVTVLGAMFAVPGLFMLCIMIVHDPIRPAGMMFSFTGGVIALPCLSYALRRLGKWVMANPTPR